MILPEPFLSLSLSLSPSLSLSLFESVSLDRPPRPPTLPSYLYSGMCQALDFCDVSRPASLLLHRKTSLLILAWPCVTFFPPTDQAKGQIFFPEYLVIKDVLQYVVMSRSVSLLPSNVSVLF